MDLTGINNRNEYYTNAYFASTFVDKANKTISEWKIGLDCEDVKTPWSKIKAIANFYARENEKLRNASEYKTSIFIAELAEQIVEALGYEKASPINIEVGGENVPIYIEVKQSNGAPLLWILLATNDNNEDINILETNVFDINSLDSNTEYTKTSLTNTDLVSKLFFDTDEAPRWIILINSSQIVLLDRNKWAEKRFLDFDLETIYQRRENSTYQAMSVLLHKDSLCPTDGSSLLDSLDEDSHRHAADVSKDLKYSLRECIELLGNEVLYDMSHRLGRDLEAEPVDAGELTIQCLRFMYRMLFLLFIEARPELGYAPINNQTYFAGYSLESLRDVVDSLGEDSLSVGEGYYLHETLSKLYDLIYEGYPNNDDDLKKLDAEKDSLHDIFTIEPLKAHIFDRAKTPMLRDSKIRNSVMLKIIDLMSLTRKSSNNKGRRGRISYAALGINQLGAVYEALLSYRGFIAEHDLYEVKRAGDDFNELDVGYFVSEEELNNYKEEERVRYESGELKGRLRQYKKGTFIYRLAGREREKSASFYTPECLTKCLVKYALKELLENKTADEILELKVCEPAMGSAAFLNEAINQLAESYILKKEKELNTTIPFDKRWEEIQKVKMYIADNNVYGVDLNPTAVELAEVSLWLNTIYPGGYVPWFNTQLVNGNSLIGARRECYHISLLDDTKKKWYDYAPTRVQMNEQRKPKSEVYHFLLGDTGMCNYTDKVIKGLEKENIEKINNWRKRFCNIYTGKDIDILLSLSQTIDELFVKQVELKKDVEAKTADRLPIFGKDDTREISHTTIREKDEIFQKIYKSEHMQNAGPYARLKFAMDYWCALWFWPIDKADMLPTREEFLTEMSLILTGKIDVMMNPKNKINKNQLTLFPAGIQQIADDILAKFAELGTVNLDALCEEYPRMKLVRDIAEQNKFMHWELEFADIFADRGGFDLMVGNPPWLKLTWEEKGLLSDKNPLFAVRKLSATETKDKRDDALSDIDTYNSYLEEYVSIDATKTFLNATQNYEILKGQQTNLYKCFLPQSWKFGNNNAILSFLHPDSIYDDSNGGMLRKTLYPKLKKHFQFMNMLQLFEDVHQNVVFSINVYSNGNKEIGFENISNLYHPKTVEECYTIENCQDIGIRDKNNNWNVNGDKTRVIKVTQKELTLFANILDDSSNYKEARIPVIHLSSLLDVLNLFNKFDKICNLKNPLFFSEMLHETNAQKDGTIKREVHFPESMIDMIYNGPHIYLANPLYKTSRAICNTSSDYDLVDLNNIKDYYTQRSNYTITLKPEVYQAKQQDFNNLKYNNFYRLISRKMLNLTQERTLISAIIPPKTGHINGLIGFASENLNTLTLLSGLFCSLPYDFFIKMAGKTNLQPNTAGKLPMLAENKITHKIKIRALMLNCLTKYYDELWQDQYNSDFNKETWSKDDERLDNNKFKKLAKEWEWETPLRTDYERRQALVEIDVLTSMALGMSLEQLKDIYNIQFYILKNREKEQFFDKNGRIVPTNKIKDWDNIKDYKAGQTVSQTITDDTMPNGPIERTITYVAPFDKCDREQDYETAWKFFEEKFKNEE